MPFGFKLNNHDILAAGINADTEPVHLHQISIRATHVCATLLIVLTAACHEATPLQDPPLPATAEGLAGTTWQLDDIAIEFGMPPDLTISGKALPFGKPAKGTYVVHDGIVEITAFGKTRAGTWDGRSMVVDGIDARFMSKK